MSVASAVGTVIGREVMDVMLNDDAPSSAEARPRERRSYLRLREPYAPPIVRSVAEAQVDNDLARSSLSRAKTLGNVLGFVGAMGAAVVLAKTGLGPRSARPASST